MNSLEVMPKKTVPTTLIIDNPVSSVRLASLNVGTGKGWKGLNHVTLAVRHKENTMKNTQAFLSTIFLTLIFGETELITAFLLIQEFMRMVVIQEQK